MEYSFESSGTRFTFSYVETGLKVLLSNGNDYMSFIIPKPFALEFLKDFVNTDVNSLVSYPGCYVDIKHATRMDSPPTHVYNINGFQYTIKDRNDFLLRLSILADYITDN
ncbi:hypothetical protein KDA11_01225 [Candidatus Saccharibacteria bacterium]|nr:hypothetical protein [Candidatus Saccharibacteria bacterium]